MMTMMMMQRLLQNNNNNNNGYADETRLNGIRHHSASPFSKPSGVPQATGTVSPTAGTADGVCGEPDAALLRSPAAGNELVQQPPSPVQQHPSTTTAAAAVQTGSTCTTVVTVAATSAETDDRLTSDEDDELNVDEDPVDLTNNRLHGGGGRRDKAGVCMGSATSVPMDIAINDYETSGGAACNKGRLAFSVENILDPNKFTKKLIAPTAVLPRWRPRVDFTVDSSLTGKCVVFLSHIPVYC